MGRRAVHAYPARGNGELCWGERLSRTTSSPFRFHALKAWPLNGRGMAARDPVVFVAAPVALRVAWGFCCVWFERSRRKTLVALKQEDRKTLLALERQRKKRPSCQ
jgi:hypothetical protein